MEKMFEKLMYASRWIMAPIYLGLSLVLFALGIKFFQEIFHILPNIFDIAEVDLVLITLSLIDITLVGGLLIMVMFSGYENFVSKIAIADGAEDRPHWMGHVDSSGMKIKLIGSLVAISVIELLKDFMQEGEFDANREGWRIGIHMTFVISGVLFALMEMMADRHKSER